MQLLKNTFNKIVNLKLNPKEVIRRIMKLIFLVLVMYLSLVSNQKLSSNEVFTITCVNLIMFCIIDMLYPSITLRNI
jgi:hypothetical protein